MEPESKATEIVCSSTPTALKPSIYEKLSNARIQFHALPLKKSGENKYAGYKYFELGDFIVDAIRCLADNKLSAFISYSSEIATMEVREFDGDGLITITSPMSQAALKGCHPVQNLGAVETYTRRYLWVTLMEVVENDLLDSSDPIKTVPESVRKEQKRIEALPTVEDATYDDISDEEKVLNLAREALDDLDSAFGLDMENVAKIVYQWKSSNVKNPQWRTILKYPEKFKTDIKLYADGQNFK